MNGDRENDFSVQQTKGRIGNHTRLIRVLLDVLTLHTLPAHGERLLIFCISLWICLASIDSELLINNMIADVGSMALPFG